MFDVELVDFVEFIYDVWGLGKLRQMSRCICFRRREYLLNDADEHVVISYDKLPCVILMAGWLLYWAGNLPTRLPRQVHSPTNLNCLGK